LGPNSGTPDLVAQMCIDVIQAITVYNQNKGKTLEVLITNEAHIGIHCEGFAHSLYTDQHILKEHCQSLINYAYQLCEMKNSILTTALFVQLSRDTCTYDAGPLIYHRGKGLISTHKLIKKAIVQKVEENPAHLIPVITSRTNEISLSPTLSPTSAKKKGCYIM
jgi:hypothetical protein